MADETSKKNLVPSRAIAERYKFGETIAGLFATHAEALGAGLKRELGDGIDGQSLAVSLGKRISALGAEMIEADIALQRERDNDGGIKEERAKAEEELRNAVHELQEVATGMFGAGVLATFKLHGTVASDVAGLLAFARDAAEAMSTADADALPKPRIKGAQVDLKEWAAQLSDPAGRLAGILERLASDARSNEGAASRKSHALDVFDKQFRRSIDLLENLLKYVGETDAADKVKPALRGEG